LSLLGIGTDIAAVGRFADILERFGTRFLERCFTPAEREIILADRPAAPALAAERWAAKEALLKALGRPVKHIPYRDIEVLQGPGGGVSLHLQGQALKAARSCSARAAHLSLGHDGGLAVATVILESAD
jgi:holo-[acyl-carrier protein] synthase